VCRKSVQDHFSQVFGHNVDGAIMKRVVIHRPARELKGKELTAHTVASFMVLQGALTPNQVQPEALMKADALKFLIRDSAISHWTSRKNGWLEKSGDSYFLTETGFRKTLDRANGNAGGQSFDQIQLGQALARIKGDLKDYELVEYAYFLLEVDAVAVPEGASTPRQLMVTTTIRERLADVKAWVIDNASGTCEGCNSPAPFRTDQGIPYLEVHHVVSLADGGSDSVENTVALCPNCHRRLHLSADRNDLLEALYQSVARLVRE
jgi:hypothetical protein